MRNAAYDYVRFMRQKVRTSAMEAERTQDNSKTPWPEENTSCVRLGEVIQELMAGTIRVQQLHQDNVAQAWLEVVPLNLQSQCRLMGMKNGVLHVAVSSPSYLFEFQMCQQELLHHLQQACSSVRLRQIKYRLG